MADHSNCGCTRRDSLRSLLGASLVFPAILSDLLAADGPVSSDANPLAPKPPHFPPRAKRVIFLHMSGGVSHVDTFDPKPTLIADHGKTTAGGKSLLRTTGNFPSYRECGPEFS